MRKLSIGRSHGPLIARIAAAWLTVCLFGAHPARAAHPLITDDPGTQGAGKTQVEVNGQSSFDRTSVGGTAVVTREREIATILSYGIGDSVDIIAGVPYQQLTVRADGAAPLEARGMSDATLEVKWRIFEKEGLALAVKPGAIFPTGDEARGLGAGKMGYSAYLIGSDETGPVTLLANLGYIRHENRVDERKDQWHLSAGAIYKAAAWLRLVVNAGRQTDADKQTKVPPAFFLAGTIIALGESCDIDFGVKTGLNEPEADRTYLAGIAFRF